MNTTAVARMALGTLLLVRPTLATRLTRVPASREARVLTRVLGGRYLGQGGLGLLQPHDPRVDAGIDLLHAGSMLPVACVARQHARLALLSAGVAVALAGADLTGGHA